MSLLSFYHVDAFTSEAFGGATAAVFASEDDVSPEIACALTNECREPVSAFLRVTNGRCQVRFFTEHGEIGLVGHAGLAAAFVLLRRLRRGVREAVLESPVGGILPAADADAGGVTIELGASPASKVAGLSGIAEALNGLEIEEYLHADFGPVAVLGNEGAVRAASPDPALVAQIEGSALILTAPGDTADFVSRVFAPKLGLPEDPVCGTAHRILVPYWSGRLDRSRLTAHQVSWRNGHLDCEYSADRVRLSGGCVVLIEGTVDSSLLGQR